MSKFELTFVAPGSMSEKDVTNTNDQIIDLVEKHSDKLLSENKWGKRMLAYPINKEKFGFYTTLEFESDGSTNASIEKALRLNKGVLRFLLTRGYENSVALVEVEKKKDDGSRSAEESLRRGSSKREATKTSQKKSVKPKKAVEDESERKSQVDAALEGILTDNEDESKLKDNKKKSSI